MKKGIHPQMQWISYVTQRGQLMTVSMTKIHETGKVYHFRAKRQMAQSLGQIAKFNRKYGGKEQEKVKEEEPQKINTDKQDKDEVRDSSTSIAMDSSCGGKWPTEHNHEPVHDP